MSHAFSEALTELRRESGLSQKQAAAELGVSQALLSHYENGIREPKLDFVTHICDYYRVTADRILGRTGSGTAEAAVEEATEELLQRLKEETSAVTAAASAVCLQNAADMILYLLNHPGCPLPPELLIREQQGFADLMGTQTEGD